MKRTLLALAGLCLTLLSQAQTSLSNCIPFRQGDRWGYVDAKGNTLISPRFEEAGLLRHGRARVRQNGRYGFVDAHGNMVIEPKYQSATEFDEYAKVCRKGKCFYIDAYGHSVPDDKAVAGHCGGVITCVRYFESYQQGQRFGLLLSRQMRYDSALQKYTTRHDTLPGLYDEFRENGKGLVAVRQGDKWGMLDQKGRWVLPLDSAQIEFQQHPQGDATQYYGKVRQGRSWGVVNEKGEIVIPVKYESIGNFDQGLVWVKPFGKAGGYADQNGHEFF
ncbi:MAG: WG repeat-containing protein [Saprospiraceae bacterium]|nr:WG repeat-containing protein [Saprospiraceae bacterium]